MKFITLLGFLGLSFFNISSYAANLEKEYWLFLGNPGAGKSTIINSLLKQKLAQAGSSIGEGLTKKFALYPHENITYVDTPGLDDIRNRAEAAKEIEKALKQNGKYRIFFIVKLDSLRVKKADLDTIETVLDAITCPNIEFNILVNQLTKRDKKTLNSGSEKSNFYSYLQAGKYKKSKITFIDLDTAVQDGDSEFLNLDDFLNFAYMESASMHIPQNCIRTVDGESQEEKLEKARKELKRLADLREQERKRTEEAEQRYYSITNPPPIEIRNCGKGQVFTYDQIEEPRGGGCNIF